MRLKPSVKPIRCRYCDKDRLHQSSLLYYLANQDELCEICRKQLCYAPKTFKVRDIEVQSFYEYNDFLKSMILQYKECYDEALKDVFFYDLNFKLKMKYRDFTIVLVPSSQTNLKRRGFNHLALMCQKTGLPIADILEKEKDFSQNNLGLINRQKMVNNIKLKDGAIVPERILLVDDILTTGSSIYGSYKALKNPYNHIIPITLSYVNNVSHSKI